MRLDVACAAEGRRYVAHSAAMLHSLIDHHREHDLRIHYLHGPEYPAKARERMTDWVAAEGARIDFIEIPDDRVAGLPTRGFTRKATWYRIFLPELLGDVDRLLYLDSDLIVTDSLAPLWDMDMEGNLIGAVTNVFLPTDYNRPGELGLPGVEAYFNAGVLLMDLAAMRRDRATQRLLDYSRANAELVAWRDQDAVNVVFGEQRLDLHPRWNCMNAFFVLPHAAEILGPERLAEAVRDPAIRHFEGPEINKPWHYLCSRQGRELYNRHRAQTPWPRVRREGVTPGNVLRRLRSGSGANA